MSNCWKEVDESLPDENRKLIVTNNVNARDAFGQPSHVWVIGLLQEMDDPEGGYCGYSGDDLIQNITHWRYLDEALTEYLSKPAPEVGQSKYYAMTDSDLELAIYEMQWVLKERLAGRLEPQRDEATK